MTLEERNKFALNALSSNTSFINDNFEGYNAQLESIRLQKHEPPTPSQFLLDRIVTNFDGLFDQYKRTGITITVQTIILAATLLDHCLKFRMDFFHINVSDLQRTTAALYNECLETMKKKGADYSGADDVNRNFKETAKALNLTPRLVWAVFVKKHIDAVSNAVARNPEAPERCAESIHSSLVDIINYCIIFLTFIEEGI